MAIQVEIEGKGVVAEFPDGTDQSVIDSVIKRDYFTEKKGFLQNAVDVWKEGVSAIKQNPERILDVIQQPLSETLGLGAKEPLVTEGSDTLEGYGRNVARGIRNTGRSVINASVMLPQMATGLARKFVGEPVKEALTGGEPVTKLATGVVEEAKGFYDMIVSGVPGLDEEWVKNLFENPDTVVFGKLLARDIAKGTIKTKQHIQNRWKAFQKEKARWDYGVKMPKPKVPEEPVKTREAVTPVYDLVDLEPKPEPAWVERPPVTPKGEPWYADMKEPPELHPNLMKSAGIKKAKKVKSEGEPYIVPDEKTVKDANLRVEPVIPEKGLVEPVELPKAEPQGLGEKGFIKLGSDPSLFQKPKKEILKTIREKADYFAGTVSTRLSNIVPQLRTKVRRVLYNEGVRTTEHMETVKGFLEGFKRLDNTTKFELTKSLINGDVGKTLTILKQHGMKDTYEPVIRTFKKIREDAIKAGYDLGEIPDYFARVVADPRSLLKELSGGKEWTPIDARIKQVEEKLGHPLDDMQKAVIADTMMKGYNMKEPYTDPTHVKPRTIAVVPDNLVKYYMPADEALIHYIQTMNRAIEKAKFFGKNLPQIDPIESNPIFDSKTSVDRSIGQFVIELKKNKNLTFEQEMELKNLLGAVFNPAKTGSGTQFFKEATYLATLGNLGAALTQIQDLALVAEKAGYLSMPKGLLKRELKMKDLGIESIAHELQEKGSLKWLLDKALKINAFTAIDRLGKETLINSSLHKFRKLAAKNDPKFNAKLEQIFGNGWEKVRDDFKNHVNSDNVKFMLFNELSDIQPISRAEVPEAYLRTSGGKIFYALKTYQIKLFDVYRNEIIGEIKKGNYKEGIGKLIRFSTAMAILGATTDQIKDWMFGRKTDFSDKVIDNVLKLGGVSKYTAWTVRNEGFGTAMWKSVSPPIGIIDDLGKDIATAIKPLTREEELKRKGKEYNAPKYLPVFGKHYYWWFGKGKEQEIRKEKKRFREERSGKATDFDIPNPLEVFQDDSIQEIPPEMAYEELKRRRAR